MKVLRAMMLASVCALTAAGSTSALLRDVERTDTNVIVVETPTTASIMVTETSTVNVMTTSAEVTDVTEITATTAPAPIAEITTTTDVVSAGAQGVPVVTQSGGLPIP